MRLTIVILGLIASAAAGQTTHERFVRIQEHSGPSTSNMWTLAWSDRTNAPHWWAWYAERGGKMPISSLPVMVDMDTGEQVAITNGNAQARQDLTANDEVKRPAKKALMAVLGEKPTPKAIRQAERQARKATLAATTYPLFRIANSNEVMLKLLIEDYLDEKDNQ